MQLLLRLFVAPWKLFTKKLKNKTLQMMTKPLKIILAVVVSLIALGVVFTSLEDDYNSSKRKGSTEEKVFTSLKKSPENNSSLNPDNPNGTLNGLNLMLINNIKTEGYVKEILTLYKGSTENVLDDYGFQVPMEVKLGIQADETGLYDGTLLPKSYLPTKNGIVVWKESFDGIPAEQMTVENLHPDNAISLVDRYPDIYGQMSYNVGISAFQGLYQNSPSGEVNGFPPSKLNWLGSSTGRPARTYYQPDGMSYLNGRLNRFVNDYFNDAEIEKFKQNIAMASITVPGTHNAGEAGFMVPLTYGYHWNNDASFTSESGFMALESLYNDLNTSYAKFPILAKNYYGHGSRVLGAFLLCEAGWNLTPVGYNWLENYGNPSDLIASHVLGEGKTAADLMSYFKSKISSLPSEVSPSTYHWNNREDGWIFYNESSNPKGFMFKYDSSKTVTRTDGTTTPFLSVINNETLGQAYSALFQGQYIYATALKYAGVDVDPTDPSTYLNSIPEGEWKPSGDTAWMAPYIKDMSQLNSKRIAVLNEAYKWLGSWYTWGGVPVPEKDANGEWIQGPDYGKGFDCSSYVQHCIKTALGIDVSRSTYSQIVNENLEDVSESEAKPGDLIYYYYTGQSSTEHVAIYLGKENGVDVIMHAPVPGKRLCIAVWDGTYDESPTTRRVFKRVKGIDN